MRTVKALVFGACLVPLAQLVWRAFTNQLTANPIEFVTHHTGDWALRLLLVTLAITPVRRLTGWRSIIGVRRMLGLFAFFYATLHLLTYVALDYFFAFELMVENVVKNRYITAGLASFLLMAPLAVTSTKAMIRRLGGRRWQMLHRLVYVSAVAAVVHYMWLSKIDFRIPLSYAVVLAILLGYRLCSQYLPPRRQPTIGSLNMLPQGAGPSEPGRPEARCSLPEPRPRADVGRFACWTFAIMLIASTGLAAQSAGDAADLATMLVRVGRRVEDYYARARTIICTERVLLQPLRSDLASDDRGRELVYELRVEWEPPVSGETARDAQIVRQLLSVNGRAPRSQDERGCTDPLPLSPEPLAVFLRSRRDQYVFSWGGRGRTNGRATVRLDYKDASSKLPEVSWKGDCVTVDVPAKTRGRAWVDAETGDVLRLDESFVGLFDFPVPPEHRRRGGPLSMTIERSDTSIRYRNVTFSDPDETLLLPATIDTLLIIRNAGTPRLRMTQTFSHYKRFTTESRIAR